MILPALPIGFGLVAVTALAAVAARRTTLPPSIFLVLVGLGLGFIPGMPRIALRPDLVLSLLLPPLLYSAGVGMSWRGFRKYLKPILLMAVGCVLFTAASVAVVARYVLDLTWSVGFVLGAVVAPPDAVAPMAIARRFAIPNRVLTILEGEGLVNDATALILFSFAIAAVIQDGRFSPTAAVGGFTAIVAGETAWGLLVGWGGLALRRMAGEPRVEVVLAMLTPYAAFWVPESLGGSGVLAAVTAGLFVSWNGPRFISPATRLQGFFVWDLVVYLIEGVIFLLTGLQAPVIADTLGEADWGRLGLAAVSVTGAIILVRFTWVFAATYLPCLIWPGWRKHNPPPPWQETFAIGFTGIRGVVSLAAALSIPLMSGPRALPRARPSVAGDLRGYSCDAGGTGIFVSLGHSKTGPHRDGKARGRRRQKARNCRPRGRHRRRIGATGQAGKRRPGAGDGGNFCGAATVTGALISWRPVAIWKAGKRSRIPWRCNWNSWRRSARRSPIFM